MSKNLKRKPQSKAKFAAPPPATLINKMPSFVTKSLVYAAGLYFAAVNIGAYGLFWFDKQQALNHGWRIPEKTLQFSALLGGWPAGMMAMEHFRHKTKKEPFRTIYFGCTALNAGILLTGGYLLTRNPALLQQIRHQIKI